MYTTGTFFGAYSSGNGSPVLTSQGSNDIFIHKMDANGQLVWLRQIGGSGLEISNAIAVDDAGNVYLTGSINEDVDMDPGSGVFNASPSAAADV
ncbi:MAG: SBBP repeat-containing protein, partial [Bacteroidota bacterium]